MMTASAVTWTELLEVLAVAGALLSGVVYMVWSVACGAKRCAASAAMKVERGDAQSEAMQRTVDGFRTDMNAGFDRVHERLDKLVGGE